MADCSAVSPRAPGSALARYAGREPHLVGVLKGALPFMIRATPLGRGGCGACFSASSASATSADQRDGREPAAGVRDHRARLVGEQPDGLRPAGGRGPETRRARGAAAACTKRACPSTASPALASLVQRAADEGEPNTQFSGEAPFEPCLVRCNCLLGVPLLQAKMPLQVESGMKDAEDVDILAMQIGNSVLSVEQDANTGIPTRLWRCPISGNSSSR